MTTRATFQLAASLVPRQRRQVALGLAAVGLTIAALLARQSIAAGLLCCGLLVACAIAWRPAVMPAVSVLCMRPLAGIGVVTPGDDDQRFTCQPKYAAGGREAGCVRKSRSGTDRCCSQSHFRRA